MSRFLMSASSTWRRDRRSRRGHTFARPDEMAGATVSVPGARAPARVARASLRLGSGVGLATSRPAPRGSRGPSRARAARGRATAMASGDNKTDENSPPYQVAQRKDLYELRIYGAYYVAAAPYTNRERGLASLMGYIEGGNEDARVFPATQPLVMRYAEDEDGDLDKRMELSLGAGVTDPPAPTTDGVGVVAAGGELLAVVGFEGIATPELVGKYRELLTAALDADGIRLAEPGAFRLATYGQLYSLKPRLNELLLKVKLPGA